MESKDDTEAWQASLLRAGIFPEKEGGRSRATTTSGTPGVAA